MANLSNTGKTLTLSLTHEEHQNLESSQPEWMFQTPEFNIDENGIGRLTMRPDMLNGHKLQRMKGGEERWMLVVPSKKLPLAPYFKKVEVSSHLADEGRSMTFTLPRELPVIDEVAPVRRRGKSSALAAKPKAQPRPKTPSPVVLQPVKKANLRLMVEGEEFAFEIPLTERLRLLGELNQYRVG